MIVKKNDKDKEEKHQKLNDSADLENDENKNLEKNKPEENDEENDEEKDSIENKEINEITDLKNKIDELEENLKTHREEKLRILADMENLRKRSDKEKIDSIKFGSSNLARDILSPCDNLIRALDSVEEKSKNNNNNNKALINGLKLVHQELISILDKYGVKKIDALNNKFDHNFHQAMLEVETEDKESGIVVQELQAGYTMHDRLLRPSLVGVSKKKAKSG